MRLRLLLVLALSSTHCAMKAAHPARAVPDVGYVDLQRALMTLRDGKEARAHLMGMRRQMQQELEAQATGVRSERQALRGLSAEERPARERAVEDHERAMAQRMEEGRNQLSDAERSAMSEIFAKMDPLLERLATAHRLEWVFERGDARLAYASPELDFTDDLIRAYEGDEKRVPRPGDGARVKSNLRFVRLADAATGGKDRARLKQVLSALAQRLGATAVIEREGSGLIRAPEAGDMTQALIDAYPRGAGEADGQEPPFAGIAFAEEELTPADGERLAKERGALLVFNPSAAAYVAPVALLPVPPAR